MRWAVLALFLLAGLVAPSRSNAAEPVWSVGGQAGLASEIWKNGEGSALALPSAQIEVFGRATGALEFGGEAAYFRLADETTMLGSIRKGILHVGPVMRIGRRAGSRSLYGELGFGWYREFDKSDSPFLLGGGENVDSGGGGSLGLGMPLVGLGSGWAFGLEARGHLAFWSGTTELDGVTLATLTAVVRHD